MTTPARPAGPISPVAAAQEAIDTVRRFLFPFRIERWLALGFVAFLDQCGRGGGGSPFPPTWHGGPFRGPDREDIVDIGRLGGWMGENVWLAVVAAAFALAVVLALTALVIWLSSRGIFMYVDNVATGRSDVARPWREHAERAGSLFAWRFGLAVAGMLLASLIGAFFVAGALGVRRGRLDTELAMALGVLLLAPLGLAALLAFLAAAVALRDFAAPLQYRHGVSCGRAVELLLDLIKAHPGSFLIYALLKLVFAIAAAMALSVASCLTCCIGFIPVVHQTLFQPVFYFERSWSLCLLRQMGHDVFGGSGPPPPPEVSLGDLKPLSPPPPS